MIMKRSACGWTSGSDAGVGNSARAARRPVVSRSAARVAILLAVSGISCQDPDTPRQLDDIRYDVTFDRATSARRSIHIDMTFTVRTGGLVSLSVPAWTPGSYELDNYARNIRSVSAEEADRDIRWDKADYDTWRLYPEEAGRIKFSFDYGGDDLDTGGAWARPDFAFFNGTNLFPFPDGQELAFPATVRIHTEPEWAIATGLLPGSRQRDYTAANYHDLVDNPMFIGVFELDSMRLGDAWYRLATYPSKALTGDSRATMWKQIEQMLPPLIAVTGDVPWDVYTILQVFDDGFRGGSALEHSRSHLGIYDTRMIGSPFLANIVAHEIFHGWNVKRLRPAEMWPYEYDHPQPTELLWVSEGVTDYYDDLALVRGGISTPQAFYQSIQFKIGAVDGAPPVALEDASLSAWVRPTDGTSNIYYPKGSLAGLMLDILVRDASDNRRSLDDVIDMLYDRAYMEGRGFTAAMWWEAVTEAAGGRSFQDFQSRYIDGREPYPWDDILPLAGLRLNTESHRVARLGTSSRPDGQGMLVTGVSSGGAAETAGVEVGDHLISVGGIDATETGFGADFRRKFEGADEGTPYAIVVARNGEEVALSAKIRYVDLTDFTVLDDPDAPEKAIRIREGILKGATDGEKRASG